jgi:hypothetical protein
LYYLTFGDPLEELFLLQSFEFELQMVLPLAFLTFTPVLVDNNFEEPTRQRSFGRMSFGRMSFGQLSFVHRQQRREEIVEASAGIKGRPDLVAEEGRREEDEAKVLELPFVRNLEKNWN